MQILRRRGAAGECDKSAGNQHKDTYHGKGGTDAMLRKNAIFVSHAWHFILQGNQASFAFTIV
jgi:hypothetical protein